MTDRILQVENLNSFYGQSQILYDINFELYKNETVIVLGRNGMGKTTLLRSIMNMNPPDNEGSINFKNLDISKFPSYDIAKSGIGLVPQGRRLFPSLSVYEHLTMTHRKGENNDWTPEKVFDLFPEIARRKNNKGTDLSGGEQQMLAIGRALVTNPSLLLLDEPLEGLAPVISEKVIDTVNLLKEEGITILWVEQKAVFIEKVADRVIIIEKGEIVYQANTQEFIENQEVKSEYLGV